MSFSADTVTFVGTVTESDGFPVSPSSAATRFQVAGHPAPHAQAPGTPKRRLGVRSHPGLGSEECQ
eukprot:1332204-Rhodomonas_salina.1